MISWDDTFSLFSKALNIREEKISLISSNLANQDTPEYKARDISFKDAMDASIENEKQFGKESSVEFSPESGETTYAIKFRKSISPAVDGNTVDTHYEKIAFLDNVVRYNSTLAFIKARKSTLMQVIKGA